MDIKESAPKGASMLPLNRVTLVCGVGSTPQFFDLFHHGVTAALRVTVGDDERAMLVDVDRVLSDRERGSFGGDVQRLAVHLCFSLVSEDSMPILLYTVKGYYRLRALARSTRAL